MRRVAPGPLLAAWLLPLLSCGVPESEPSRPWWRMEPAPSARLDPPDPAWDCLIAGGDTVLARRMHDYVARHGAAWPLAGVAALLREADAALVNLECCVALGGFPAEKGERNPCYFRARPEMLGLLTAAGIDALTLANNHAGDYGPLSVAETLRWTAEAGLVAVGAGLDLEQAWRPALIKVGRTRVALAGMDTTMPAFHPGPGRPGVNHAPEGDLELFEERVRRLGEWARGRCDLLVLTLHWGRNWDRETSAIHRKMAALACEAGVDLILGHSAHRLQGVEIVQGKLVVYDMGNLLLDGVYGEPGKLGGLFRLRLSAAGVHRLEFLPASVLAGRTLAPGAEQREAILAEMEALCAALGTRMQRRLDGGVPIGVVELARPAATARPPVREDLVFAAFPRTRPLEAPRAERSLRRELPREAVRLEPPAELAPGVELLGYRLPEQAQEGTQIRVATWWRVRERVREPWLVALDLRADGAEAVGAWAWRHDPGDWSVPLSRLEPGEIVEDLYPARLGRAVRPGLYEVRALVLDPRESDAAKRVLGRPCELGRVVVEDWRAKE